MFARLLSRLSCGGVSKFDVHEDKEDDLTVCTINAISQQIRPIDSQVLTKESRKDQIISSVVQ